MTSYREIIYPSDEKNPYPQRLADHLYGRFIAPLKVEDRPLRILDIGCCTGKALKMFNKRGDLELYGIDIRDEESEGLKLRRYHLKMTTLMWSTASLFWSTLRILITLLTKHSEC